MTGEEMRKFRLEHGLTMVDLGRILGFTNCGIQYFEKHNSEGSKIPKALEKLLENRELFAQEIDNIKENRSKSKPRIKRDSIGYIPSGKSFDEYNAKLLNLNREADKLGLSYGNYIAMRRDNCDGKNISKSIN